MTKLLAVAASLAIVSSTSWTPVDAGACKPVKLVLTRAVGNPTPFQNGSFVEKYPLSTVNFANVDGALKFVLTETVDFDTGYTNSSGTCTRKNGVNYINFYEFTFCNPDAALWWFNQRDGDKNKYKFGEYGQYLTMDGGQCHDNEFCNALYGENKTAKLGQFIGWQNVSNDDRNPTPGAYWYSAPGECPTKVRADKSAQCIKDQPTGECPKGKTPDGIACTYSYKMLGVVNIDALVGIMNITNPKTGAKFQNHSEYCLMGNKELERDPKTFEYVSGLPFYKNLTDPTSNTKRIEHLLAFYAKSPNNMPLPSSAKLTADNPPCYQSDPRCFKDGKETCGRDASQLCVPCEKLPKGCTSKGQIDASKKFPSLKAVEGDDIEEDKSTDEDKSNSAPQMFSLTIVSSFTLLVGLFFF